MKQNAAKNKLSITAIALIVLVAFLFSGVLLYAYFSADKEVDADVSTVPKIEVDVSVSGNAGDRTVFKKAGDKYEASVSVTNRNAYAISYGIAIGGITNSALRDALILSVDDRVFGVFSNCADADGNISNADGFLLAPSDLADGGTQTSRTHKITLELHSGAGAAFSDASNDVSIFVSAKSFVNHDYIFVKTAEEFYQAIRSETLSSGGKKTITLVNDLDLSDFDRNEILIAATDSRPAVTATDAVVSRPARIDLNGKTLKLNTGLFFSYADAENSAVYSSFKGGNLSFANPNAAGLIVDTPNAVFEFGTDGKNFENFGIDGFKIAEVSDASLAAAVSEYAESVLNGELTPEPQNILGGYRYYLDAGRLNYAVSPSGMTESVDPATKEEDFSYLSLSVGAADFLPSDFVLTITFRVTGAEFAERAFSVEAVSGEDLADEILREFNAYFFRKDAENRWVIKETTEIARDLYLPDRVRNYNAEIEWISSDPEVLSEDGRYHPSMRDKTVVLTAIVSFEGVRVKREFNVKALAFSPAERLRLMLAEQAVVFTKSPDRHLLAFDLEKYNLTDLTYAVDAGDASYLETGSVSEDGDVFDALFLKDAPDDDWSTEITVNAKAAESGAAVVGRLKVRVSIERSVSIVDEANRSVQNNLPGGNTFLSFPVPSVYNEAVKITYAVKNGLTESGGNRYYNADNVEDYVAVSAIDADGNYIVTIDPMKVPTENSTVYILVSFEYSGTVETRVVSFRLSGILHNRETEIQDFSLYVKLLNIADKNGDLYLTRDEADAAEVKDLTIQNAGIKTLKGLEYFRLTGSLDFANNKLTDISALKGMYELTSVNFSFNNLTTVSALSDCTELKKCNLSNNVNLMDVSALENAAGLEELYLYCELGSNYPQGALSDISFLKNMKRLKTLEVYKTGVSSVLKSNINAILTAYFNALDNGLTPQYYIDFDSNNKKVLYSVPAGMADTYRKANNAINALNPVYEFANVIYLPPSVDGFQITWQLPSDVFTKAEDDRVIINRPIADLDVVIVAEITAGSQVIARSFPVVSRGGETKYYIETSRGGALLDAASVIPDPNLRVLLFREFNIGTDTAGGIAAEYVLTYDEITRVVTSPLAFDNRNIADLGGLEYFTGIRNLNLSDNPFTDISPLNALAIETLIAHDTKADLSAFYPENPYTLLDLFGADFWNDEASYNRMLEIYNTKLTDSGKIYKDNKYEAPNDNKEWKPYTEELDRLATLFWDTVTLKAGAPIELTTSYRWKSETKDDVTISYKIHGDRPNKYFEPTISKVNGISTMSIDFGKAPPEDVIVFFTVTLTYKPENSTKSYTNSPKMQKAVYVQTNDELLIETDDKGTVAHLHDAVRDSAARQCVINALGKDAHANGDLITRTMLRGGTENGKTYKGLAEALKTTAGLRYKNLTYSMDSAEGLQSLAIFEGIETIDTLTVLNASERFGGAPALEPIKYLADTLKTLRIEQSYADLTELPAMPALTELTIFKSNKIVMTDTAGHSVFDQSGENVKFPALTTLNLADNYITSAAPLAGLRKVANLTFYGNPVSKSAVTDSVITGVYNAFNEVPAEEFEGGVKPQFMYYVISKDVKWVPNLSIANTITEAGASMDGKLLTSGIHGVNYLKNGDRILLPKTYEVNTVSFGVEWSTAFTSAVVLSDGAADFVNPHDMTAYVALTAYIKAYDKTIEYYFAVSGDTSAGDGANYVNFDLFTEPSETAGSPVLADPYFAHYAFSMLREKDPDNTTGLYAAALADEIVSISLSNTFDERRYAVTSLKGAENFKNLATLEIDYNGVTDLTPIAGLVNLKTLSAISNEITTLKLSDGTSVFANLTKLTSLKIGNNNIDDFRPIVYSDGASVRRVGLENLKTLFFVDTGADETVTEAVPNDSLWLETLEVWLNARQAADASFSGVELFYRIKGKDVYWRSVNTREGFESLIGSIGVLNGNDGSGKPFIPDTLVVEYNTAANEYAATGILRTVTADGITYNIDYDGVGSDAKSFLDVQTDRIRLLTVGNIKIGGNLTVRASVYTNQSKWKLSKEILLDTSVLNPSDPKIEVTAEEMSVYVEAGRLPSEFEKIGDNYRISAEKLIPDFVFRLYCFRQADKDSDRVLTVAERNALTTVRIESQGLTDITGFELFPMVSSIQLEGNRVSEFPRFVELPYETTAELSVTVQDDYIADLSGLLNLKKKDGSYRVKSLVVNNNGSLGQSAAEVIRQLPLEALTLKATGIHDFSFLLGDLRFTLDQIIVTDRLGGGDRNDFPEYTDFYGYRETMLRVLFETSGSKGGGLTLSNGSLDSTIEGLDPNEMLLYPYLNKIKSATKDSSKDVTIALDEGFEAFGQIYALKYELPSGSGVKLNGYDLTIPKDYKNDSFSLIVRAGISDGAGGIVWTYRQETPFYFTATAAEVKDLLTDGDVEFPSGTVRLSSIVPDVGLRTAIMGVYDLDFNGVITQQELSKYSGAYASIKLTVPSLSSPMAIQSFEGIGYFAGYFNNELVIYGVNTGDLSPLGNLTNVKKLNLNSNSYYFKANGGGTHANISDWSFLTGMKSLKEINLIHTDNLATGLEYIVDCGTLQKITGMNEAAWYNYSTLSTAVAYSQARNDLSDFISPNASNKTGNLTAGTREDQKLGSMILFAIDFGLLTNPSGKVALNAQKSGEAIALPKTADYENTAYEIEYLPLTSNLRYDEEAKTLTPEYRESAKKAKFIARIRLNGALYERLLEFEITE